VRPFESLARPVGGLFLVILADVASLSGAQGPPPIQDNSFLVEEAYNQESGVVQHISTFLRADAESWSYSFTQEWPLGGIRHQLSYTIPIRRIEQTGIGDILLNYRYQAVGDGGASLALSPRLSLSIPSGNADRGHGVGGPGLQMALPLNWRFAPRFTFVGNAGLTWVPRATNASGQSASTMGVNLGASTIWSPVARVNFLLEAVWARVEGVDSAGGRASYREAFISPGVRWAFNSRGGWQVVPGVAYTVGIGPARGNDAVFLYLSIEHPFGGGS
jgi:hypothetical protein